MVGSAQGRVSRVRPAGRWQAAQRLRDLGQIILGDRLRLAIAVGRSRAVASLGVSRTQLDQDVHVAPAHVGPPILHLCAVAVERAVVQEVAAVEGTCLLQCSERLGGLAPGGIGQQPIELVDVAPGDHGRVEPVAVVVEGDGSRRSAGSPAGPEDRSESQHGAVEGHVRAVEVDVRPDDLEDLVLGCATVAAIEEECEDRLSLARAGLLAAPTQDRVAV